MCLVRPQESAISPPAPVVARRWLPLLLLSVLAGCTSARPGASDVAAARAAAARTATTVPLPRHGLVIERPAAGAETDLPWAEVRGSVGSAELYQADLVIALDLSVGSMMPSGLDLDEDGEIGALRGIVGSARVQTLTGEGGRTGLGVATDTDLPAPRRWATDPDDTILQAELAATRAILRNLAARGNRFAIVTYDDRARLRAPLGAAETSLEAIERIRMPSRLVPTSVARALREARLHLGRESLDADRRGAVLLFTAGRPSEPDPYLARLLASNEARSLREAGIDLYLLPIGPVTPEAAEFLIDLARVTGGRLFRVGDPDRLFEDAAPVQLLPRRMEIVNATTGAAAEGVRIRPDGRFDAFVPLVPGANKLRVVAELADGRVARWEQDVRYAPPGAESEAQREARERIRRELEERAADAAAVSAEPL